MSLLGPWLAFPAVLAVLCLGAGLLVERAAGTRLPGQLLLPLGFAALVAVTQLTTFESETAPATLPVVLVLVALGYVLSIGRLRSLRPDKWLALMAGAIFCMFAAPAVLWGSRTFLGYGNLGDAAVHFGIVDQLLRDGHSVAGLPESSFTVSIGTYFATAYPTGAHSVLATARAIVGIDVAWVFQPFLTCLAVLIALGLERLARELTDDRRLSALVGFLAGGSGLLYAYAVHQEAIKELAAVALLVLLTALVAPLLRTRPSWRAALPLAVATGGGLGVLSFALAPWLGPLLLVAAAALALQHWSSRRGLLLAEVAVFVVVATVLAIPRLAHLQTFVNVNRVTLTAQQEVGNLRGKLDFILGFGVWPADDFRSTMPPQEGLAIALVGVALIAGLFGVLAVWRRGAWQVGLFAVISLVGFAVVARSASPWGHGKALMILSPALTLLAAAGALGLVEARRRFEGLILLGALVLGVLWTNAQAYHGIDAAPHDRLDEMARIGERFAGQGPALFTEFDEYAKHFLRDVAPTGASEAFKPPYPEAEPGAPIRFGFSTDVGSWRPASLSEHFELLVVRRGPTQSRPPAGWERVFAGTYYDVWKQRDTAPQVLAQADFGSRLDAAGEARCRAVGDLAGIARAAGGELAYVERAAVYKFVPTQTAPPRNWGVDAGDSAVYRPVGPGRVAGTTRIPAGSYSVWFEASAQREAAVYVDDQFVGSIKDHLNPRLSATELDSVNIDGADTRIRIDVGGGNLEPGNGGYNRIIGPVFLTPVDDPGAVEVRTVPASRWRSLCGRNLDWVQALS